MIDPFAELNSNKAGKFKPTVQVIESVLNCWKKKIFKVKKSRSSSGIRRQSTLCPLGDNRKIRLDKQSLSCQLQQTYCFA